MDNKKILPRRLYEAALEINAQMEPASDYKDAAANMSRALNEAASNLNCVNILDELGMPDGFSCPRSFHAWWDEQVEVEVEPLPPEEEALLELATGLKYAAADLDPQWYDMGTPAMCAMAEYPEWLAWKADRDEDDVELHGDSKRIALARTQEFRDFLVAWVKKHGAGKEG